MVKKNRPRATPKAGSLRAEPQKVEDVSTQTPESSTSALSPSGLSTTEQLSKAPERTAPLRVPIVGIGASAGGLDAFRKFLTAMPLDSGLAVVLVPHLDPQSACQTNKNSGV